MQQPPPTVRVAVLLWVVAVGAGIVETTLAVTSFARSGPIEPGLWLNLGFRALVFTVAAIVIVRMGRGHNWARITLVVMLGGIGLASMVVPTAMGMLDGQSFLQATAGGLGMSFVLVRVVHLASVPTATALMFLPSANAFFVAGKATGNRAARDGRTLLRTS